MPNRLKDITNQRFGRWLVLHRVSGSYWMCQCDCGTKRPVQKGKLLPGFVGSCGCLRDEQNRLRMTRHGHYRHPLYATWSSMVRRCTNQDAIGWHNYGGRGVKVCDRWLITGGEGFKNFLSDVGEKPSPKHSLDRIDNDGDYEPSNCRWSTRVGQGRNRRTNVRITWKGETMCLKDWCEKLGVRYSRAQARIYVLGWEPTRALELSK